MLQLLPLCKIGRGFICFIVTWGMISCGFTGVNVCCREREQVQASGGAKSSSASGSAEAEEEVCVCVCVCVCVMADDAMEQVQLVSDRVEVLVIARWERCHKVPTHYQIFCRKRFH